MLPSEFSTKKNDQPEEFAIKVSQIPTQNGTNLVEYMTKRTNRSDMEPKNSDFVVGGVLPLDTSLYVKRPADDELFNSILAGQSCYVLAPHLICILSLTASTE